MEKTVNIIEPGSFLHGLLNSDFDNFLLYRYLELEVIFAMIIEENNKSNPETTKQNNDFFINQLEVKIADNNRILRDLEIYLNNEKTEAGFVSLIKKNNLISVNDKAECLIKYLRELISNKSTKKNTLEGNLKVLNIPTKASKDQILDFWFRLTGNNEKGQPYWESEKEIEHFVNQNFEGFPGVNDKSEFNPNMNKSELYHVTWVFFNRYGKSKTKIQYADLLTMNFTQFRDTKNVYSNIKDQSKEQLKKFFK